MCECSERQSFIRRIFAVIFSVSAFIYPQQYSNFSQKTTAMKQQPSTQFRDIVFKTRLILPQPSRKSHPPTSLAKVLRCTWTKKVIRQKQSQQKLKTIDNFFKKHQQTTLPACQEELKRVRYGNLSLVNMANHDKKTSRLLQSNNAKENKEKLSNPMHFVINRNVYNQEIHQDLSKSGILFERLQNQAPAPSPLLKSDPRKILKNIKLKSSNNLYKGNFTRFTKRDIISTLKTRRFHLTNDLDVSPWQHTHIQV